MWINDNLSKLQQLNLSQLINRKLYKIVKIGDLEIIVSDHVANGSFKSLKDNVSYFDNPNYALFIRNIDFKKDLDGNKKYIDKKSYNYLKKSHLFGGEVVISNVADVGSVHRVPFIKKPMVVGNNQIFIKSKHFSMTDYLYVYFQSFWGQSSISSITSGSAQQKFNKTDFRSLEIPIPSEKWIQSNISPYVTLQDKIFNENQSLKQIKATLLNHCF
ncbi:restriction endonuclease subunit S [Lactobacillus crispatus]|uniref:restriction endonuclease subunit S n=1 Tax=Lactobacillus crispatus TaxID=47770 RepID=UPI00197BB8FB|nr:restriction endonuclease subunit S [Lactobacillus crispatus]